MSQRRLSEPEQKNPDEATFSERAPHPPTRLTIWRHEDDTHPVVFSAGKTLAVPRPIRRQPRIDWYGLGVVVLMTSCAAAAVQSLLSAASP